MKKDRHMLTKMVIIIILISCALYSNELPENRSVYVFIPTAFDTGNEESILLYDLIHYQHNYEYYYEIEYYAPDPGPAETSRMKMKKWIA